MEKRFASGATIAQVSDRDDIYRVLKLAIIRKRPFPDFDRNACLSKSTSRTDLTITTHTGGYAQTSSCGWVGNGPLAEGIRGNKVTLEIHSGQGAKESEAKPASQIGSRLVQVGYVPIDRLVIVTGEQAASQRFTDSRVGRHGSKIIGACPSA